MSGEDWSKLDKNNGVVDVMILDLIDKGIICSECWQEECRCEKEESRDGECEHKMVTKMVNGVEALVCDWCDMGYPLGGWDYYQLEVCGVVRTICCDCYKKLGYLSAESQVKERDGE